MVIHLTRTLKMLYITALKMSKPELHSLRTNPTNTVLAKEARQRTHTQLDLHILSKQAKKTTDLESGVGILGRREWENDCCC